MLCNLGCLLHDSPYNVPVVFNVNTTKLMEKIQGTITTGESERSMHKQHKPMAAQCFRGHAIPDKVFDNQDPLVKNWFSNICEGTSMVQQSMPEEKWNTNQLGRVFSAKFISSGSAWQATSFPDFMFSKTIVVLPGDPHFVAGIPMKNYHTSILKGNKNIADISTEFGNMKRSDLEACGGFYADLSPGDGVVIPPGYLVFQCHRHCMQFEKPPADVYGSDFMVTCLHQIN